MDFQDTYKYDSNTFAKFLIYCANQKRIFMNVTKVQKLLYICYGAYLRIKKERLLNEHPQAWPYGPVFPRVRKMLVKDENILSLNNVTDEIKELHDNPYMLSFVNNVLDAFGKLTAGALTEWSHHENSAWDLTTKIEGFDWSDEISDSVIYDYFGTIVKVNKQ